MNNDQADAAYLKSLAHVWLEQRSNFLCELSREDGDGDEWTIGHEYTSRIWQTMAALATLMAEAAENLPAKEGENQYDIRNRALDEVAAEFGYPTKLNWERRSE